MNNLQKFANKMAKNKRTKRVNHEKTEVKMPKTKQSQKITKKVSPKKVVRNPLYTNLPGFLTGGGGGKVTTKNPGEYMYLKQFELPKPTQGLKYEFFNNNLKPKENNKPKPMPKSKSNSHSPFYHFSINEKNPKNISGITSEQMKKTKTQDPRKVKSDKTRRAPASVRVPGRRMYYKSVSPYQFKGPSSLFNITPEKERKLPNVPQGKIMNIKKGRVDHEIEKYKREKAIFEGQKFKKMRPKTKEQLLKYDITGNNRISSESFNKPKPKAYKAPTTKKQKKKSPSPTFSNEPELQRIFDMYSKKPAKAKPKKKSSSPKSSEEVARSIRNSNLNINNNFEKNFYENNQERRSKEKEESNPLSNSNSNKKQPKEMKKPKESKKETVKESKKETKKESPKNKSPAKVLKGTNIELTKQLKKNLKQAKKQGKETTVKPKKTSKKKATKRSSSFKIVSNNNNFMNIVLNRKPMKKTNVKKVNQRPKFNFTKLQKNINSLNNVNFNKKEFNKMKNTCYKYGVSMYHDNYRLKPKPLATLKKQCKPYKNYRFTNMNTRLFGVPPRPERAIQLLKNKKIKQTEQNYQQLQNPFYVGVGYNPISPNKRPPNNYMYKIMPKYFYKGLSINMK